MNPLTKIYTTNKEKFEELVYQCADSLTDRDGNIPNVGSFSFNIGAEPLTSHNKQLVLEMLEGQIKLVEGMKGLSKNPDYFIKVQRELRGNQAAEGLDDRVITQIVWVAKDRVLDDILSLLHSAKEEITRGFTVL